MVNTFTLCRKLKGQSKNLYKYKLLSLVGIIVNVYCMASIDLKNHIFDVVNVYDSDSIQQMVVHMVIAQWRKDFWVR